MTPMAMMGILDCLIDSPMRFIFFTVVRGLTFPGLLVTGGGGGGGEEEERGGERRRRKRRRRRREEADESS